MPTIRPQQGFQMQFLSTAADIAIGGSAAGVGKTYALMIEPLRHIQNPNMRATYFRRTYTQIKADGGLWDKSIELYGAMRATPNVTDRKWTFPSGASIKFSSLDNDNRKLDYQGAEMPYIAFDELTQFSEDVFFYLVGRNRSMHIRPYIRATCNPDPDSWVAKFVDWWIDSDGWPIKERSGIVRYYIKMDNTFVWGNSKEDVRNQLKDYFAQKEAENPGYDWKHRIKSATFVPGSIYDNKELLSRNPEYLGNLESQSEEDKLRYLYGNWKVKLDGNMIADYDAIEAMIDTRSINAGGRRYITCDASGFGRDLTVIFVWEGWTVIEIMITTKSDPNEIYQQIEALRQKYNIIRTNVVVDSDGVGNPTVKKGGYAAFHGGSGARFNPESGKTEAYKNFKTQCYYLMCDRINRHEVTVVITGDNCTVDGRVTNKIKIRGEVKNIADLIKEDMRSVRKDKPDSDGKKQMNTKENQKEILHRSPDFGDTLMMRYYFVFHTPVW